MFAGAVAERRALNVVGGEEFGDGVVDLCGCGHDEVQTADEFVDARCTSLRREVSEDHLDAWMRAPDDDDGSFGGVEDERDFRHVVMAGRFGHGGEEVDAGRDVSELCDEVYVGGRPLRAM